MAPYTCVHSADLGVDEVMWSALHPFTIHVIMCCILLVLEGEHVHIFIWGSFIPITLIAIMRALCMSCIAT